MATIFHDEQLIALLRARGRRVTSQRLIINRVLRERETHLTAEAVREAVIDDLPGISMPTIYATLDLLVELELAQRVEVGVGAALYDARTEPHHHAVCRDCARVQDLDGPLDTSPLLLAARRAGFRAESTDVLVTGHCSRCLRH